MTIRIRVTLVDLDQPDDRGPSRIEEFPDDHPKVQMLPYSNGRLLFERVDDEGDQATSASCSPTISSPCGR